MRSLPVIIATLVAVAALCAADITHPEQSLLVDHSTQQPHLQSSSASHNVSAALFAELEELARLVDISYCVGPTGLGVGSPFSCLSRCADFPDLELVKTWNTGPFLSDSCGYIALDHAKRRLVVAFRGTYSIANTVVDLSTVPQKYTPYPGEGGDAGDEREDDATPREPECRNCTVHMGFHRAWRNTRDAILSDLEAQHKSLPDYRLNLVGHSLGGAVAALAGLDFQARGWDPLVTTFGEPRVGNTALAHYIDDRFQLAHGGDSSESVREAESSADRLQYRRITHVDDPVPLLPLTEWGYAMHAGEIHISKASLSPDVQDLRLCAGDNDQDCIAGQDSSLYQPESAEQSTPDQDASASQHSKRNLIGSVRHEIEDVVAEPWGVPSRYKLWQLFFAHRDYFWRLGLCVPGGDPMGGGGKYEDHERDT